MKERLKEFAGNIWFWIVGIIGFLSAYAYYLVQRNKNLQSQIDFSKHREDIQRHADKLQKDKEAADNAVDNYKRIRDEYIASDDESGGTSH